eukprot:gnl/TRDRNA2_/TRDRNA2_49456_c0_seq1.p1 gnl/TRDRNA2_/TRDRNA2_49456_c0~~gnl/TRDRNA2_/TRDRNA2_49456_c0_seq1.p1  ORF type:complete len:374 (-),score=39.71 gnl/TRDRNA2_/TRDRNA2_49456_c0_seq1:53-1174(-)
MNSSEMASASGSLRVSSSLLWTPDVVVLNAVGGRYFTDNSPLVILSGIDASRNTSGGANVLWRRPMDVRSVCHFDISLFPFDTQRCHITVGSWALSRRLLRLVPLEYHPRNAGIAAFVEEFRVSNFTVEKSDVYTIGAVQKFEEVVYSLVLQRYPHYYVVLFILPMLCFTMMAIMTMWMGNHATRMNSGTTLLICVVQILNITVHDRPAVHGGVWLDRYQSHCITLSMTAMLQSLFMERFPKICSLSPMAADAINMGLRTLVSTAAVSCLVFDLLEVLRAKNGETVASLFAWSALPYIGLVIGSFLCLGMSAALSLAWLMAPRQIHGLRRRLSSIGSPDFDESPQRWASPSPAKQQLSEFAQRSLLRLPGLPQ